MSGCQINGRISFWVKDPGERVVVAQGRGERRRVEGSRSGAGVESRPD